MSSRSEQHFIRSLSSSGSFSNEFSSCLFEPETILPSQFFPKVQVGLDGGERKLMAAILSDGIETYISQSTARVKNEKTRIDAIEWVDTKDQTYVFSFDMVCESLGLNADYIRLGLQRYVRSLESEHKSGELKTVWKKIRRPRHQPAS